MARERKFGSHVAVKMLGVEVDSSLHRRLQFFAAYNRKSMSDVVREAVIQYLDSHEPKDKTYKAD